MLRSLRARLALSHVLPVMIIAPLVTFVLVYLLETQYFLSNLASELIVQANVVGQFIQLDNTVWENQSAAQTLVARLESSIPARMMVLDGRGRLLASSLATDQNRVGTIIEMPVVTEALQGQSAWLTDYNPFIGQRIVDVAVPVRDPSGEILGVVRLSHDLQSIEQKLIPVWGLILISLLIGIALAVLLGLLLAQSLSSSLRRLARAVVRLTPAAQPALVPENGPTEVQALAKSFNEMSERLYGMEQSRRSLLASFVHELGTPLGAIKAAAQALQEGAVSDPELGLDLAEGINNEVDQLRRLLDNLTLLGETESRTPALNWQPVPIGELVETICRSYAYLVKQKNIQLAYDIDSQLPVVWADPTRLHQIISNLIHNAYKYTPLGGRIAVRVTVERGDGRAERIRLTVTDNGPGIAEAEQDRIFEMFYRGANQVGGQQGMGIGLALARRLAAAHNGTLTVESHLGQGTSFILSLPIRKGSAS